ncbi:MAG: Holliday junction resolvase RuvX [Candidatus Delongbacteria bacterium]|jgi:putative Holliday junction resolvase|nr:Holliday junction resolvase RuvX [Candidatus Delongbacteria bacterium]
MSRLIGIDYGFKRTGIAVTDPLQIIASGLDTVPTASLFDCLERYINQEDVEGIVFGMPTKDDGSPSEPVPQIIGAMRKCRKLFPGIRIDSHDESYTSKMAFQTMIDGGVKKKKRRDKALVDKISATIILQSYMEANKNK